jgi:transposase
MQDIKQLIEEKGCKLEYLPPYSPDFNPIEFTFSVIKKLLKSRYKPRGNETPVEFAQLISDAGMNGITPEMARNQFRHCHIAVD